MKHYEEDWLSQMIDEEVMKKADERERLLLESHEFQAFAMPADRLEGIKEETKRRKQAGFCSRLRIRAALVAAAALILGLGAVGVGSREYKPEIVERVVSDGITSNIENSDSILLQYDEEEVCQEIQDKLGVVPIRFRYRPEGMQLIDYCYLEESGEVIMSYAWNDSQINIYIGKDYMTSSVGFQTDGKVKNTIQLGLNGEEVSIYEYENEQGDLHYGTSFEYLNTYYSIGGITEYEEFQKIIENILIKNA